MYSTCVRSAMLHGGETWAPNVSDLQHLRRNDRAMIRWICNTKLTDNLSTELLLQRLGIYGIEKCLRLRRLRWYGHVRRDSCCINQVSNLVIPGPRGQGRPRKTWSECVKNDLSAHNLIHVNPITETLFCLNVVCCSNLFVLLYFVNVFLFIVYLYSLYLL